MPELPPPDAAKAHRPPIASGDSRVGYHVRTLNKLGAVALVRQRQLRGAIEHTYTATVRITLTQKPL